MLTAIIMGLKKGFVMVTGKPAMLEMISD